jgi:DNA-directed RNA polymerase specialized sigma24 family protein
VLACLAPGMRSLAARTPHGLDEVLSEVALGVLQFPVERRTSVAGGLLLDVRNRLHRATRKAARTRPLDDTDHPEAPGELGSTDHPTQRAVQLVCQAHRQGLLDRTDARLILDTRLGGHKVKPIADVLGLTPSAAYQRRSRAEARLVEVA